MTKQRVLAPARTVATITPQITQVQPELHVRNVLIDVPVAQPVIAAAPPVIAAAPAPIVETHSVVAASPVVEARYAHAAPVAVGHNIISSPYVGSHYAVPALSHVSFKVVCQNVLSCFFVFHRMFGRCFNCQWEG